MYIWSQLLWYRWKRLNHGSRHCITSDNIVGNPDRMCIILLFLLVHLWLFFIDDANIIWESIIIPFVVVIGVIGPLLCLKFWCLCWRRSNSALVPMMMNGALLAAAGEFSPRSSLTNHH